MREVVRSAVAELDAKGINEPGVGQWGSPIVMLKRSSGAWRLCCDYREVNKHVTIPQQPLPCTDDTLASFKGKRYFSVMEMCHGFYQIEIGPKPALEPLIANDSIVGCPLGSLRARLFFSEWWTCSWAA